MYLPSALRSISWTICEVTGSLIKSFASFATRQSKSLETACINSFRRISVSFLLRIRLNVGTYTLCWQLSLGILSPVDLLSLDTRMTITYFPTYAILNRANDHWIVREQPWRLISYRLQLHIWQWWLYVRIDPLPFAEWYLEWIWPYFFCPLRCRGRLAGTRHARRP